MSAVCRMMRETVCGVRRGSDGSGRPCSAASGVLAYPSASVRATLRALLPGADGNHELLPDRSHGAIQELESRPVRGIPQAIYRWPGRFQFPRDLCDVHSRERDTNNEGGLRLRGGSVDLIGQQHI